MSERIFGTYELNEEEIAERSQQMAETLRNLEAKGLEKKEVSSRIAAEINEIKKRIYELRNQVLDGKQTGYFDCEMVKDYTNQVKRFVYNGQILRVAPFTEQDKQMHIAEGY